MAEKIFTPETADSFTIEELLLALPIAIIKNNRICGMSFRPVYEKDINKIRYAVIYRCETSNDIVVAKADNPRQALLEMASTLIINKFVAEIKNI